MQKLMFAVVAMMFVGCGGEGQVLDGAQPVDGVEREIVGGSTTSGHPAVGLLFWSGENTAFCTGFLVAPRIVMTAAHCTAAAGLPVFLTGTGSRVASTGGTLSNVTMHAVEAEAIHPDYDTSRGDSTSLAGAFLKHKSDVALYRLAEPIVGVAPLKLATTEPALGCVCTVVGFGRDSESSSYGHLRKRAATMSIVSFQRAHIEMKRVTGETASGDSGGPSICAGGLVSGITSISITTAGNPDVDYHQRVWTMGNFVETTAARWKVAAR